MCPHNDTTNTTCNDDVVVSWWWIGLCVRLHLRTSSPTCRQISSPRKT